MKISCKYKLLTNKIIQLYTNNTFNYTNNNFCHSCSTNIVAIVLFLLKVLNDKMEMHYC